LRKVPTNLALRLILALTLLISGGRFLFGYLEQERHEELLLRTIIQGGDELSQGIESAIWHAMLADDRNAAYQIMEAIGQEEGIERVRIINKRGAVTYSTMPDSRRQLALNDPPCRPCHASETALVEPELEQRARVVERPDLPRLLEVIKPIRNEPSCSDAACHAHPAEREILGVLAIDLELDGVDRELADMRWAGVWLTLVEILLIAAIITAITRFLVGAPIQRLTAAAVSVGHMDLDRPVEIRGRGELAALGRAFDDMRLQLRDALRQLKRLNEGLEDEVRERTEALTIARQRLVQSDRLASLGQLAASVAHEINNPVSGVLNLSMVCRRMLESDELSADERKKLEHYLEVISRETERVGRIVTDLLAFSRRSSPESAAVDPNELVGTIVTLLSHKFELLRTSVHLDLDEATPTIEADSDQIQQVLVNLLMNAAESMEPEGGALTVRTRRMEDEVLIEIEDEGCGISEADLPRVFDPFFTTKPEGKGVGLGLSVVYGIIDAHGGSLEVKSEEGKGTICRVILPRTIPSRRDGFASPDRRVVP
jgi:two-component system NtrC family sensor kinase